MLRVTPDISRNPPRQESYRQYDIGGLPYTGNSLYLHRDEYRARTAPVIRAGFGNFDTAKPDERQFGRTLNEVLTKHATGEYKITEHQTQWIRCEQFGVRMMVYIQWNEWSERPITETIVNATNHPVVSQFPKG